ncbi:MAG: tRNA(fMet)-specific endonuclease VapC [Sphingomonadales bacterium]|jgi:tRNA(fMet)-specific endonuclease VapC|nr:tRNA(fMet)-specific endonuclease VapC [Sphingomonadales bacterium]
MAEYLLDTNVLSDLVKNPFGRVAGRVDTDGEKAALSLITVGEILYGLRKRPSPRLSAMLLETIARFPALAWDSPAEERYAQLRAELERRGTPIGANDMLIAAHALALDCILVTANEREFRRVPGLKVENWAA